MEAELRFREEISVSLVGKARDIGTTSLALDTTLALRLIFHSYLCQKEYPPHHTRSTPVSLILLWRRAVIHPHIQKTVWERCCILEPIFGITLHFFNYFLNFIYSTSIETT